MRFSQPRPPDIVGPLGLGSPGLRIEAVVLKPGFEPKHLFLKPGPDERYGTAYLAAVKEVFGH